MGDYMGKQYKDKNCKVCGRLFTPKSSADKCCCDECKDYNSKKQRADRYQLEKTQKRQAKRHKTNWSEITSICKEAGLSYGEAVVKGVI